MRHTPHVVQRRYGTAPPVLRPNQAEGAVEMRKVTYFNKNYAYRFPGIHHGVHPRLALRARRTNHFRSPELEFPRLRALVCDPGPPF